VVKARRPPSVLVFQFPWCGAAVLGHRGRKPGHAAAACVRVPRPLAGNHGNCY